jgi:hypothetical protein
VARRRSGGHRAAAAEGEVRSAGGERQGATSSEW